MVNNNNYKVEGAKAGDKPRQPNIAKDSVSSISTAKILYGLNDGEISGIVGGGKGIKLEDTPLLDEAGKENFKGVKWDFRAGTLDQEYIEGFPDISNETGVGVELKGGVDWIKAISNPVLSAVRIRLSWNGLRKQNTENGDVSGYKIDYAIDVKTGSGAYIEVLKTNINDKVTGKYERTHRIALPKSSSGWQIRVRRLTPNANLDNVQDKMFIESITEVIDQKFTYPHTSLLGIQYDAKTFSRIAKLAVRCKGKLIKIPSNYNSDANTYTGVWNGQFKLEYSNNPAWIFYDLVTSKRYGLGKRIDPSMVDKWSLYDLGAYCDALVPDGQGSTEKRYTCNVYLQSQAEAYQILSQLSGIFRAITYWSGQQLVLSADVPKDPTYTFSRANVIDGQFEYTGTRARDRHTVAKVAFDNPKENFKTEYEYIRDEAGIAKFGINVIDISAIGCTSRGQAQRAGLWALKSEQLETRTVTFRTGLEGFNLLVGEVIEVSDELLAGRANGGRITAVDSTLKGVTVDREAVIKVNDFITVNAKDGVSQRRKVVAVSGKVITVLTPFVEVEAGAVWAISSVDLNTMQFRVMSIKPDEDNIFAITAIQHEPLKYAAVDHGADVKPTSISIIKPTNVAPPASVGLSANYRVVQGQSVATLVIQWSQVKDAVGYSVEWRRNDGNWIKLPLTGNVSAEVEGVYEGNYQARVKSVNAFDVESDFTNSIITNIKGKVGSPKALASITATGILFGMDIKWNFLAGSEDTNYTEIQTATDASGANTALLGSFSYPTDKTTINGLQGGLTVFYRGRIVDKLGNAGNWSAWVSGTTDDSADKVLELLNGEITESQLNQSLTTKIDKIDSNSSSIIGINTGLDKAKADIIEANNIIAANKLEAANAVAAANTELSKAKADIIATDGSLATAKGELATAKTDITKAKTDIVEAKRVADLAKTDSAANKTTIASLTTTVGNNKTSVDSSITTLTNKDLALTNLYTALKSEYDTNKASVSTDLTTLTNKDISLSSLLTALDTDYKGNKTAIRNELTAVSNKTNSTATSLTSLTTEVGKNATAISTEATTRSTEDTALSNRITTVSGKTDNALSRITTAETTIANNTGAITQQKTDITAAYKKAIDDIEIGGRNLLTNTEYLDNWGVTWGTITPNLTENGIKANWLKSTGEGALGVAITDKLVQGEKYILSLEARGDLYNFEVYVLVTSGANLRIYDVYNSLSEVEFKKIEIPFIYSTANISSRIFIGGVAASLGQWLEIKKGTVKLEKGNKATAWTAAPEDVEASITAAITTESTARTSAVEAVANTVTALDTRFEGNKTSVTNALTTLTNKDTSLANSITALTTTVGNNTTAISTESTARSTADTAIGNRITTVEGKTDNALSRVSTVETIAATNKSSIASTNTKLEASFIIKDNFLANGHLPVTTGSYQFPDYILDKPLVIGDTYKVTVRGELSPTRTAFQLWNHAGQGKALAVLTPEANGIYTASFTYTGSPVVTGSVRIYQFHNTQSGTSTIDSIEIVRDIGAKDRDSINASVAAESKARSDADTALTNLITTLDTDYKGNKTAIRNELTAVSNKANSTASSLSTLTTTVGDNTTKISQESTARSTADTALGNRITATDAIAKNAQSRVGTAETAISNATSALATTKTELTAAFTENLAVTDLIRTDLINQNDIQYPSYYNEVSGAQMWTGAAQHATTGLIAVKPSTRYIFTSTRGLIHQVRFLYLNSSHNLISGKLYPSNQGRYLEIVTPSNCTILGISADYVVGDNFTYWRFGESNSNRADISNIQTTVANNTQAIAKTRTDLVAEIANSDNFIANIYAPKTSGDYAFGLFDLSKPLVVGDSYTVIVKGSLAATKTAFQLWNQLGSVYLTTLKHEGNNTYTGSFTYTGGVSGGVRIYVFNSNQTGSSTINSIELLRDVGANERSALSIEATATANKVTGLYAQYTVKLDVGGRVSGFGLASSTTQSDFAINADKFYIAPPTGSSKGTSPFMVLTTPTVINGVTVPTGTYIQSAYIHNGSIDIAKINKASITSLDALTANIGHFKSAPTGARLEIKDSLLSVYDSNNKLRVRLGIW